MAHRSVAGNDHDQRGGCGVNIGSLFSGYGGLDQGVQSVLGGTVAWYCDNDPGASKILAHHWPDVPNLGDITAVDWTQVEPVDVITGGSPCQDVSHAGKRAGMKAGTRSGLWASMCDAIDIIRPALVVWENVRGVLSAEADSNVEPCPLCVGDGRGPTLRALGRVLGDLAELGYDAQWTGLRAADVGAPHGRFRVFVVAYPDRERLQGQHVEAPRAGAAPLATRRSGRGVAAPDSASYGRHEGWTEPARIVRGPDAAERGDGSAADADRGAIGTRPGDIGTTSERQRSSINIGRSASAAADAAITERRGTEPDDLGAATGSAAEPRECPGTTGQSADDQRRIMGQLSHAADDQTRPDQALRDVRDLDDPQEVRPEPDTRGHGSVHAAPELLTVLREHQDGSDQGRIPLAGAEAPDMRAVRDDSGSPRPPRGPGSHEQRPSEPDHPVLVLPSETALARGPGEAHGRCGEGQGYGCSAWGQYAPAIHRWEIRLGRLAPAPTEPGSKGQPRLAPLAVEFMMGLPAGHVTAVPGLSRNDQLKALGNGVVPQQAAAALTIMLGSEDAA